MRWLTEIGARVEFAASCGFSIETLADALRVASIGWPGTHSHCFRRGPIAIFATDPMELNSASPTQAFSRDGPFYLFDGQCSIDEQFFHPLLPKTATGLARRIDNLLDNPVASRSINAGVFVAGRLDHNAGLTIVTDALSQYPIYYFQSGARFIVSNVLRYITAMMAASGEPVTPTLTPCVEAVVIGGALGDTTHIREIRRLPFGHDLVADPRLRFRPRQVIDRAAPYAETIASAQKALSRHLRSVAAATRQPRRIVTDLTAGSDSRLILSLLLDSPLRSEITGRCVTRYPHPDANVAGALFTRFGLPIGQMPVVMDVDPRHWRGGLDRRRIEANAAFTGGARQIGSPHEMVAFPNLVHFTGRFGELGGSTRASDFLDEVYDPQFPLEAAIDRLIDLRRRDGGLDLISDEGVALARSNALAVFAEIDAEGIPREQLQAEFYLRVRCRSHFGLSNWLTNKSKIAPDPLASWWLVEARYALPRWLHSRNKVVFDLLRMGGTPDLTELPLDERVWDPAIIPVTEREKYQVIEAVTALSPALSPMTGALMSSMRINSTPVERMLSDPAFIAELQALAPRGSPEIVQTRFGNEMMIAGSQQLACELLDRAGAGHDIWSLLDREVAIGYARRNPADFAASTDVGAFGQIISGILWVLDQPTPPAVAETQNFGIAPTRRVEYSAPTSAILSAAVETDLPSEPGGKIAVDRKTVSVRWVNDGQYRTATFTHLLENLVRPRHRTLLDLGAGAGHFSAVAARLGYQVTAVDARGERFPADPGLVRFVEADVRDFDPAGFGVVAILGLLYHLEIGDQLALLQRCAYGVPVIVETQIHVPAVIGAERPQPWHRVIDRDGYRGIDVPERGTAIGAFGNATSFWHTENSLVALFADAGYSRVTLIDPLFRSVHGARRFYLLSTQ